MKRMKYNTTMKNFYNKLGDECFNHFMEINPKGGMREFIRMAVEFGYKRAIKDDKKWFSPVSYIIGLLMGVMLGFIIAF